MDNFNPYGMGGMPGVTSLSPFGGMSGMGMPTMPMGQFGMDGMSSPAAMRCMGPSPMMGMGMGMGMGGMNDMMMQMMMMQQQLMMMLMQVMLSLMSGRGSGFGGFPGMGGLPGMGNVGGGHGVNGGGNSGGGGCVDSGPVHAGVDGLLSHANRMVGLEEHRDTAAIEQVTGKSGINPASTPWCAAWAMNMLDMHGVLDLKGLSNRNYCPSVKSWAQGKHIWQERGNYTPKAGDAILFDWNGDNTPDHIGIVERVSGGKVYTIEGNSSDKVSKNSYALGSGDIDGYLKT